MAFLQTFLPFNFPRVQNPRVSQIQTMSAGNDNSQTTIQQDLSWIESLEHVPNGYPTSLRVLIVDHNPTCLAMLEDMAKCYFNQVSTCQNAEKALSILRENQNQFDILMCELHMPGMDGLKLLEAVRSEIDLPVIIVSEDERRDAVMKSLLSGACDYLLKPVRKDTIGIIWQHVVRKKRNEKSNNSLDRRGNIQDDPSCEAASVAESSGRKRNRLQGEDKEGCQDTTMNSKKPRINWTDELHEKFLEVVNELGIKKAVPKKILECMERKNIKGLTRENVASHLQKYRLNFPDVYAKVRRKPADSTISLPISTISPHENPSSSAGHGVQVGRSSALPPLLVEPINKTSQDCYPANNRHCSENIFMGTDPFQYSLCNDGPSSSVFTRLRAESGAPFFIEDDYICELLIQNPLSGLLEDQILK